MSDIITQCSVVQGNNLMTAQKVVDLLQSYFPGWEWTASVHQCVLYIKNLTLSEKWGMQFRIADVDKRRVIAAGGEILDRFNMPTNFTASKLYTAPRDFTGAVRSEKWTPDRRYYNRAERRWRA